MGSELFNPDKDSLEKFALNLVQKLLAKEHKKFKQESESQKPLAIVIIGGLVTATVFTLLVFPIFFYWAVRKRHLSI